MIDIRTADRQKQKKIYSQGDYTRICYNFSMLEDKWKLLIKQTVQKYLGNDVRVFLFGSRATGTNRKWSDADAGILANQEIAGDKMIEIESEISESDIPYLVEVVDFQSVAPEFAKIALSAKIDL